MAHRQCDHCGRSFEAVRSTRRFCSDACRVNAYQKAKRKTRQDRRGRPRATRRIRFPNGCWAKQEGCLARHPQCTCARCKTNVCTCVVLVDGAGPSVPVSGLLVPIHEHDGNDFVGGS